MKKLIVFILPLVICVSSFSQTTDTLAGFYSNGLLRKVYYTHYTVPNLANGYFNRYGNFVAFNTDSIAQGSTNKWYTDALARAAVSLTTTGTSGAATYNSSTGVFNIPQYAGTTYTGTTNRITVTGSVIDISSSYVGQSSITTHGTITSGGLGTGAVIGGVTMTMGSDATGDIYYRNSSGILTRLPIGSSTNVLTVSGGLPTWSAAGAGGGGLSDTTYFWSRTGNTATAGSDFFGTKNNVSLRFRTNNTNWFTLDSLGRLTWGAPGSLLGNNILFYDNGSTSTRYGIGNSSGNLNIFGYGGSSINLGIGKDGTNLTASNSDLTVQAGAILGRGYFSALGSTGRNCYLVFDGGSTSTRTGIGTGSASNGDLALFTYTGLNILFGNAQDGSNLTTSNAKMWLSGNGNLEFGTSSEDANARINVVSTTKGIVGPRMTTTQRDAVMVIGGISTGTINLNGSGYVNGTYTSVPLTNISSSGSGALATFTVTGTTVTGISITTAGIQYRIGDTLTASNTNLGGTGSGFKYVVTAVTGTPGLYVYNTTSNTNNTYNGVEWTGNALVTSAGTLTLTHGTDYIFTGSTTTWTLPAVSSGIAGRQNAIWVKNRGSGSITLNSNTGSTLYTTSAQSTITIAAGAACELMPDGTYFNVMFNL